MLACLPAATKPAVVAGTVETTAGCAAAVVTGIVVDGDALPLERTAVVSATLIFVMPLPFVATDDGSVDTDAAVVVAAVLRQVVPWSRR